MSMDAEIVVEVKIVGCSGDEMRQERDRSSRQVPLSEHFPRPSTRHYLISSASLFLRSMTGLNLHEIPSCVWDVVLEDDSGQVWCWRSNRWSPCIKRTSTTGELRKGNMRVRATGTGGPLRHKIFGEPGSIDVACKVAKNAIKTWCVRILGGHHFVCSAGSLLLGSAPAWSSPTQPGH